MGPPQILVALDKNVRAPAVAGLLHCIATFQYARKLRGYSGMNCPAKRLECMELAPAFVRAELSKKRRPAGRTPYASRGSTRSCQSLPRLQHQAAGAVFAILGDFLFFEHAKELGISHNGVMSFASPALRSRCRRVSELWSGTPGLWRCNSRFSASKKRPEPTLVSCLTVVSRRADR